MFELVPARLRPEGESVPAWAVGNLCEQPAVPRRDRIDDAAVAAREPEHLAVRRDAAHVRAAAARNRPLRDDLARAKADHGDRPLAAVRGIEVLRVATRVEAVDAGAGA